MQIQQGTFCPLVQGECKKFECMFFTEVHGTNPNTGQPVNEWNCAIALMPMLLIEGAQQSRATGAAVESFRNESCQRTDIMNTLLSGLPPVIEQAHIEVEEPDK